MYNKQIAKMLLGVMCITNIIAPISYATEENIAEPPTEVSMPQPTPAPSPAPTPVSKPATTTPSSNSSSEKLENNVPASTEKTISEGILENEAEEDLKNEPSQEEKVVVEVTPKKEKKDGEIVNLNIDENVTVEMDGKEIKEIKEGEYEIHLKPSKDFQIIRFGEITIDDKNNQSTVDINEKNAKIYLVKLTNQFREIERDAKDILSKDITTEQRKEIYDSVNALNKASEENIPQEQMDALITNLKERLIKINQSVGKKDPTVTNPDDKGTDNTPNDPKKPEDKKENEGLTNEPSSQSSNNGNYGRQHPTVTTQYPSTPSSTSTTAPNSSNSSTTTDDKEKKYADATIKLLDANKQTVPQVKVELIKGDETIGTAISNEEGNISLNSLDKAEYTLKILEVPSTYRAGQAFKVKLNKESQTFEYTIEYNTITLKNNQEKKTKYKIYDAYTDKLLKEVESNDKGELILDKVEYGSYYFLMGEKRSDTINVDKTFQNTTVDFGKENVDTTIDKVKIDDAKDTTPKKLPKTQNSLDQKPVKEKQSNVGKIIGTIVILILVIGGGIGAKFWSDRRNIPDSYE